MRPVPPEAYADGVMLFQSAGVVPPNTSGSNDASDLIAHTSAWTAAKWDAGVLPKSNRPLS